MAHRSDRCEPHAPPWAVTGAQQFSAQGLSSSGRLAGLPRPERVPVKLRLRARGAGVPGAQGTCEPEMDLPELKDKLIVNYPAFAEMPAPLMEFTLRNALVRSVPAGSVMFDENNPCQAFPMLLEGVIRVSKVAANGRELQLYRVVPGEACILSTSCMLGTTPYTARGVADTNVTVLALTASVFNRLLSEFEPFRSYVFSLFSERIIDLMQLVEAVAFHRLDQRLASLLLGKGRYIHVTHQALADELGSVREIVSRLLKSFAEQGVVSLGREQIEIVDPSRLRQIAAPA